MKYLASVFKISTGLLAVIPGITYFNKGIYPVNIPAALLIAACEVIGVFIILTAVRNKDRIKRLSEKKKVKRTLLSLVVALLLFIGLGILCEQKVVSSRDKARYLLPVADCCSEYSDLKQIAHSQGENIVEHLGVDKLTRIINNNCPFSAFGSQVLFFSLVVLLYNALVFIFIFLGLSLKTRSRQ